MTSLAAKLLLVVVLVVPCLLQTQAPPKPAPSPTPQKPTPTPQKKPAIAKQPALTPRVFVISVNGLSSDHILRPERYKHRIPNIVAVRDRGSYAASVEGVYPSLTLPAHASIASGMLPSDHGIYSDYPFSIVTGSADPSPFSEARQIAVDTIWESARRSGLKSLSLEFPLTAGGPIDFRFHQADGAPAINASIDENRVGLALLNFVAFGEAESKFGVDSREAIQAIETIDAAIGTIVEKQGSEATFVITSDSPRVSVEREFKPNVVLAKKGLLIVDRQGKVESWRAIAVAAGGAAIVFVKDPKDEKLISEVDKAFREIYEHPESPIWRILNRQEATRIGADPRAALFLDAAPLFVMSSKTGGAITGRAETRASAGYLPQRSEMRPALIIAGRGVKAGVRMEFARLIDLAPTISRLLGLELRTSRGRVLDEVLVR